MHYERKGFATIAKMRLQLVFLCVVDLRTLKLLSRLILYWKCYCTCTDSDFSDCIHLSLSWGINEWRWLSCIIPSLLDVWNTNKNIGLKILQSSRERLKFMQKNIYWNYNISALQNYRFREVRKKTHATNNCFCSSLGAQ